VERQRRGKCLPSQKKKNPKNQSNPGERKNLRKKRIPNPSRRLPENQQGAAEGLSEAGKNGQRIFLFL
jgi:hypothetical protein